MIARFTLPALAALAALALAAAVPSIPQTARRLVGLPVSPAAEAARPGAVAPADDGHGAGGHADRVVGREGVVGECADPRGRCARIAHEGRVCPRPRCPGAGCDGRPVHSPQKARIGE